MDGNPFLTPGSIRACLQLIETKAQLGSAEFEKERLLTQLRAHQRRRSVLSTVPRVTCNCVHIC